MPLRRVLSLLALQHGISVISEAALDDVSVTAQFTDTPADDAIAAIARRVGVQVYEVGKVRVLGQLRQEDKGVLVRRVGRVSPAELQALISGMLSEVGRIAVSEEGIAVVGDRVEVLTRVADALDRITDAPSGSWACQLHVFEISRLRATDLGLDTGGAIKLVAAAGSGPAAAAAAASVTASLDTLLIASKTDDAIRQRTSPLFLLAEGIEARLGDGETLRIPKKSVAENGATTTTGFEVVETGLRVKVTIRPIGPDKAFLSAFYASTQVVRFVQDVPITAGLTLEAQAAIESEGCYLLQQVQRVRSQVRSELGLKPGIATDDDERLVQLWARVFRIGPQPATPSPQVSH